MTTSEIIRNVAPIVAIATTITVAIITQWWKIRKALSYAIISNTSLLSHKPNVNSRISILVNGQSAQHVRIVIVRIGNTGRLMIDDKDFAHPPLRVIFGEQAKIITADVIARIPEDLPVEISEGQTEENRPCIEVKPIVLNRGDSFTVQTLVAVAQDHTGEDVKVGGRIRGITKFTNDLDAHDDKVILWLVVVAVIATLSCVAIALKT